MNYSGTGRVTITWGDGRQQVVENAEMKVVDGVVYVGIPAADNTPLLSTLPERRLNLPTPQPSKRRPAPWAQRHYGPQKRA